jgi:hypothetical protein
VFGFCSVGYGDHKFARNLFRQDLQSACPIIRLKTTAESFLLLDSSRSKILLLFCFCCEF